MNSIQEKALFHLTGCRNLDQVDEETLIKLTNSYPYFAPAQLLLTSKLKQANSPDFSKQAQKTGLYFSNPYWLHYLLNSPNGKTETSVVTIKTVQIEPEEATFSVPVEKQEIIETPIVKQEPVEEKGFSSNISIPTIELVKEMMRGIDKQVLPESTNDADLTEDIAQQPSYEEPKSLVASAYNEEAATDLSNSKIANLLSSQLADFKKPVKEEEQLEISREPMHTVDYFASQGIKIDLSKIPQDKLTTQLRRFTDWLKYMKSDNPNPIDLGTNQDLEDAVGIIAQTSNEQKEIVTESMAEVLQKQGQLDKAIQLYIKLSFLNPEKSAYFAAKIQHLKGIQ
jgi:hypothetical protein